MATTMAGNNRLVWQYTDDNDTDWAISAKSVYMLGADAAKYGGGAPEPAVPAIPQQIRPRRVKCVASGKPDAWVIAYETDATIWTTPGTELLLFRGGIDVTYTSTKGKRGERNRDGIRETA